MRKTGPTRRLLALAAALAVAAAPVAVGQALAREHDGGRGGERGGDRGGEGRWGGGRGGAPPGWRGGGAPPGWQGREGPPPGWQGREPPRSDPRYEPRYDPRYEPRGEPYGERGYAPAPPPRAYATPRRGGYIGPGGGAPVEDPGRYRLREAPRGYMWVRVPGGMAMVSQATGQVFDVVPDR